MQEENRESLIPPYLSWPTFLTFLDRLKETTTPSRIDSSIVPNFSGAVRGQLLATLRFLGLIEPDGIVTAKLKSLISAYRTDSWKQVLSETVVTAYAPIIGDLEIAITTTGQLTEKFRTSGVSGSTVNKCLRFYLAALTAAEVPFSPHIVTRRGRGEGGNGRIKRIVRRGGKDRSPIESETPLANNGHTYEPFARQQDTTTLQVPIPGKPMATIIFPSNLDEDEWAMIDQFFRAYVKLRDKEDRAKKQVAE